MCSFFSWQILNHVCIFSSCTVHAILSCLFPFFSFFFSLLFSFFLVFLLFLSFVCVCVGGGEGMVWGVGVGGSLRSFLPSFLPSFLSLLLSVFLHYLRFPVSCGCTLLARLLSRELNGLTVETERQKAEQQRREWAGKRHLELSS